MQEYKKRPFNSPFWKKKLAGSNFSSQQKIGYDTVGYEIMDWVRLNFKEKCGTKLRVVFSVILWYDTEMRCYCFFTVPYSSRNSTK